MYHCWFGTADDSGYEELHPESSVLQLQRRYSSVIGVVNRSELDPTRWRMLKTACDQCAWSQANQYLRMSYDALVEQKRRIDASKEYSLTRWVDCGGEEALVEVQIDSLDGVFSRRMCVEITASVAGDDGPQATSIVYFQRMRSGKLIGPWGPEPAPAEWRRHEHPWYLSAAAYGMSGAAMIALCGWVLFYQLGPHSRALFSRGDWWSLPLLLVFAGAIPGAAWIAVGCTRAALRAVRRGAKSV